MDPEADTHRENACVKMKEEVEVMHLQVKEHQRGQQTTRSQEEGMGQILPQSPQKNPTQLTP